MIVILGSRWLLRDAARGPWANGLLLGLGAAAALLGGLHFGGAQSPAIAIGFAITVFLVWAVLCLRWIQTGLAVAVLGLSLGIASLTCVRAVTTGFEQALISRMSRLHGHVLVSKYGLSFFEYEAMADELLADPTVVAASPFAWGSAALVAEPTTAQDSADGTQDVADRAPNDDVAIVMVKGLLPERAAQVPGLAEILNADPRILDTRPAPGMALAPRAGTPAMQPDPGDSWETTPAKPIRAVDPLLSSRSIAPAIIGKHLGRRMQLHVGDRFRLVAAAPIVRPGEMSRTDGFEGDAEVWQSASQLPRLGDYVVVAWMDSGLSELDERLVVLRMDDAQKLLFDRPRASGIELVLGDATASRDYALALESKLNAGAVPARFRASSWEDYDAGMIMVVRRIRAFLSIVLSLIVVVAASSLVGALIVTIRRKRREIAALATMGARPLDVFLALEVIGALVGVLGGLGGVALGVLYSQALASYDLPLAPELYVLSQLPVIVRVDDMIGPVLLAFGACLLATGPPGLMAARIRPMQIFAS